MIESATRTPVPPQSMPSRRVSSRRVLRELTFVRDHARRRAEWGRLPRPPIGDGRSVMLVPGWAGDDRSMRHIGAHLERLGFDVHGWGLGRNVGDPRRFLAPAAERVGHLANETGAPVALVGHSLGGWIAREVARDRPDLVRHVVTLGTPAIGGPKHTLFGTLVHRYADPDTLEVEISDRFERPLIVPVTAIRSPHDGIVPGWVSVDEWSPNVRHIDVDATHIGMVASPEVLCHIAAELDPTSATCGVAL